MSFLDFGGGLDFGQGIAPPPAPPPPPPLPTIGPQGGQGSGIGSGLGLGGLGPQQGGQGGSQGGQGMDKAPPLPQAAPIPPPGSSGALPGGGSASLSAMTPQQLSQGRSSANAQMRPQDINTVPGASLQQREQASYKDVVRQLETSGGGTKSQHLGGASNIYQFTPDARSRFQPTDSDWNDPNTQAATLNNETAHNKMLLQNSLGRDPSDSELWLAHNQGFHGANQMLRFPDQSPVQLGLNPKNIVANVPGGVNANAYPNAPSRNFTSMWDAHYNRTAQQVGAAGGGGKDQPVPTSDMREISGDVSDIGGGGAEEAISGATSHGDVSIQQFLEGIKTGEGVPYSGFSSTGAIGAYGLTGGFIQKWAPSAGLPTDRASYVGNPALQDQLAAHAASQMHSQYGDWKSVANAWLTGSPTATHSAPGNMSPAAYDAKVLTAAGISPPTGGATPQGVAQRQNTYGGAAPEGAAGAAPGLHAREQAKTDSALAGPEAAYKGALNQPLPPPTPTPDVEGYVANWRQQHNQELINGQQPTFKGLWLGIMKLGAGMLNGAFGHSAQAVGGFGNYAEGLHRGNKRQAQEGLSDLKEGVDAMIKQYDLADRQRDEILQNRTTDISTKLSLLKLEAAKNGDKQMADALDRQDLQAADKLQMDRQKTILELQQHAQKADDLAKKWAFDENYKEKEAAQKHVDTAQKEADDSMKELMKQSNEKAKAIMQGADKQAQQLIQQNIAMAAKRRNEALANLHAAQRAQAGQGGGAPPAAAGQGAPNGAGAPEGDEAGTGGAPSVVRDKSGAVWQYKGSGDPNDKANYDQIE